MRKVALIRATRRALPFLLCAKTGGLQAWLSRQPGKICGHVGSRNASYGEVLPVLDGAAGSLEIPDRLIDTRRVTMLCWLQFQCPGASFVTKRESSLQFGGDTR